MKRRLRMMTKAAPATALALCLLAALAAAQPAKGPSHEPAPSDEQNDQPSRRVVVTLRSGDEVAGELVAEADDAITLRVAGVETRIARSQIQRITPLRSLRERYRSMRAIIDDKDVDRLLILVEWLQNVGLLDEARAELERILRVAPASAEARERKQIVDRLIALRERAKVDSAGDGPERKQADQRRRTAAFRPGPDEFPLLSPEQVNRIKVLEIDLRNPPPIRIERQTIERLLERYKGEELLPQTPEERAAFIAGDPVRVLETMFRLRARDMYGEVQALDLPESLRRFRDNVHGAWLLNSCATTRCHGGLGAGDLVLYTRARNSEQTVLTNLLILERYRTRDGQALVNFDAPQASLLLQMALPAPGAATPHPAVRGWRPVLMSQRDLRFRQAVEWIRSMHQPRPDYQIDYNPPTPADIAPREGGSGGER